MTKKQISASLPERLIHAIDKISDNRSNFLARATVEMLQDPEMIEKQVKREKQEKKALMKKKHRIELEIEEKRDSVNDLKDLKTKAKSLREIKNEIPESELQSIRDTVRDNKYDSDPRSANTEDVIEHNSKRLSDNFDVEQKKIKEVLRITTDL